MKHRVVKEAVYGKFMEQMRTMRANSNGFGGDNLFSWSSTLHKWEITNLQVQIAAPPPQRKITCYAYAREVSIML